MSSTIVKKLFSLIHKRRSIRFSDHLGMYGHMFYEDVSLAIMPYDRIHSEPRYVLQLTEGDPAKEEQLRLAIDQGSSWNLKESVENFIRETAKSLIYHGRTYYSINYFEGTEKRFEIVRVWPDQVLSIFGMHIPLYDTLRYSRAKNGCKKSEIVCFKLPHSCRSALTLLRTLSTINPSHLPEFAMKQYDPEITLSERVPVSFAAIRMSEEIRLAKLTKDIGWNGRGLLSERMTEHYWLTRQLRFERFLAQLRGTIMSSFNNLLAQVDKKIGFSCRLKLEGIATEVDVDSSEQILEDGSGPFSLVMKPFRSRTV